jgi:CheY-like chemotaxis protein
MSKVLLVEDDNNLREIYEARLQAEGYDIVSARDGEEALVVAKAEKPDLVISDVMMPKISGFEMLDILRNTEELKDVKVIMLTALGQSDDQQRADRLGADRYLVKSQVTLEDIVNVAHGLLNPDETVADETAPDAVTEPITSELVTAAPDLALATPAMPLVAEPVDESPVIPEPVAVAPEPTVVPVSTPADDVVVDEPVIVAPAPEPVAEPIVPPAPVEPTVVAPMPEPAVALPSDIEPAGQEAQAVEAQIESFVAQTPAEPALQVVPTTPPEETSTSSDAIADDQLMADAIDKLVANTEPAAPIAVSEPTGAPAVAAPTEPSLSQDEPLSVSDPSAENTVIAGKKIISPIDHDAEPDLAALLAAEDAPAPEPVAEPIVPPAPVVTPEAPTASPPLSGESPIDPNSIAL